MLCWWYQQGALGTQRRALLALLVGERWRCVGVREPCQRAGDVAEPLSQAQALLNAGGKDSKTQCWSFRDLQPIEIMKQNTSPDEA